MELPPTLEPPRGQGLVRQLRFGGRTLVAALGATQLGLKKRHPRPCLSISGMDCLRQQDTPLQDPRARRENQRLHRNIDGTQVAG